MLKKLKKIKWYWWLLLVIYITTIIVWFIVGDLTEDTFKTMPIEMDFMPFIHNYYEFWGLVQLIHITTLLTGCSCSLGYVIIKGISKNVKEEN